MQIYVCQNESMQEKATDFSGTDDICCIQNGMAAFNIFAGFGIDVESKHIELNFKLRLLQ
jgi:hypothetical protein